jgi:hypothetical protein
MPSNISYRITLKRAADQLEPLWVYQRDHPEDGAEHPTATRDRSVAERAVNTHTTRAHHGDQARVVAEGD